MIICSRNLPHPEVPGLALLLRLLTTQLPETWSLWVPGDQEPLIFSPDDCHFQTEAILSREYRNGTVGPRASQEQNPCTLHLNQVFFCLSNHTPVHPDLVDSGAPQARLFQSFLDHQPGWLNTSWALALDWKNRLRFKEELEHRLSLNAHRISSHWRLSF